MRFIYTKAFIFVIGVLAIVVVLLGLQVAGWLGSIEYVFLQAPRPVVAVVKTIVRPVVTVVSTLGSMRGVVKDNHQLEAEVIKLQQKTVLLEQLKLENELLRQSISYKSKSTYALEVCGVLSRDTQNNSDTLIISCGKDQGLVIGQAVVSNGYIVAKIVHVSSQTATAVLISNTQSTLDAKLSKNNTEGVVRGSFNSGLILDLVSQSAEINDADLVVTAGISSLIPKNILIGKVGKILSKDNDLFKKVTIVSPIKTHELDFVFVVKL